MSVYGSSVDPSPSELMSFVAAVYDDLDWVVDVRHQILGAEVRLEEGSLEELSEFFAWLADAWPGVFNTRDEVLGQVSGLPPGALSAHGLAGPELRVKVLAWRRARRRLRLAVAADGEFEEPPDVSVEEPPARPQRPLPRPHRFRRLKRVLRWTSRLLGHADTLIGSLVALVGQAERLKELKETVEKVTGEVAEDIPG